jgi:hypothetical protein
MNIIFFLVDMKGTSRNRLPKSKLQFVKLYCVIMSKVGLYALCDTIPLCIHKIRFRFSNQRAHILFYSFKLVPLNLLTPTSLLRPAEYQQIDSTSKIFRAGNKNATSKFRMA